MWRQSQKIKAISFSKALRTKLYEARKRVNIELHFTEKGLRDMLKLSGKLEKNNQSRLKIIGSSLTFAHIKPTPFRDIVR